MQGKERKGKIVITVIGAVLCVIFGLMLILNVTIIVKGVINPNVPPSVFGITPMVVQSGSMSIWNDADQHSAGYVEHRVFQDELADVDEEQIKALKEGDTVWSYEEDYKVKNVIVAVVDKGEEGTFYRTNRLAKDHIEVGDMIFAKSVDTSSLKVGDVISFMEGGIVVTHRIIKIENESGKIRFITKGDANLSKDTEPVLPEDVIGLYQSRISGIGDFALFMQKPLGMIVFIGVPLCAFIIYDIIRRQRSANKASAETAEIEKKKEEMDRKAAEMEAELEHLRKLVSEKSAEKPADTETQETK